MKCFSLDAEFSASNVPVIPRRDLNVVDGEMPYIGIFQLKMERRFNPRSTLSCVITHSLASYDPSKKLS